MLSSKLRVLQLLPSLGCNNVRQKLVSKQIVRTAKKLRCMSGFHVNTRQCSSASLKDVDNIEVLYGKEDRYRGIYVRLGEMDSLSTTEFNHRLQVSLSSWKTAGVKAAWLLVPIEQSGLIPTAARHGFKFHHAEGQSSCMYQWLDESKDRVPMFASHQVGVAGCVIREDTEEVLMVQDKNRPYTLWKFPGGLAELSEDISTTAEREVYEETGVNAEFQGIFTFRQQHHMSNAFGRSDLFFVTHLKPRTLELRPDFENEIAECQWMNIRSMLEHPETSSFTKTICQFMTEGLEKGFQNVHFGSKKLESIHKKGYHFTMYFHSESNNEQS